MLSLHKLRTLGTVVRQGGIRSSSESLLRAASAVSRSITLLEQSLGTALFERKGRGMLLTPAGELAHSRLLRIEAELGAVLEEAASGKAAPTQAVVEAVFDEKRLLAASLLAEIHHMPTVGRRLGVSQPAVSAAVARLENALGQRLFLRTARGLMPTDTGARWVLRFDRALAELRYLEDDIAAASGQMAGVITVGSLPLVRTHVLPTAIGQLLARHPRLRVFSLESPYEELCAGLLSGKIDFILGALRPLADKALKSEPLFADDLGLMAAADHPLHKRRVVKFEDLRAYPWVLSRPGTPLRQSLADFFAAHGEPAPVPAVETGDLALVRGLLLQGPMLTVLSTHQMRYEVNAGQLCMLRLPMQGLQRHIGVITRSGAHLSAAALALLQEVRAAVPGSTSRS